MSESGGTTGTFPAPSSSETRVQASSGVQAANPAVATLAGVAGRVTYLAGFEVTAAGATAALTVDVTVAGPAVTMHYAFTFPAGAGVPANPLVVEFADPIPSSAVNTAITVTVPSGGAGNTAACVTAHGYYA